jgi:integrase
MSQYREDLNDSKELAEFMAYVDNYNDDMIGICKPTTENERNRKIRRYGKTFAKLAQEGRISTCDPAKMTERDVRVFIAELRDVEHIQTSTQERALALMNSYFQTAGNYGAVLIARKKLRITVPKKEVEVLTDEEVAIIEAVLDHLPGWRMTVIGGVVYIALATGIRPGEIIRLSIDDIDLVNRTILVRFPKGNGKYQDPHLVGILRDDLVPKIEEYLAKRTAHLARNNFDTKALFPNLRNPGTLMYSDNALRQGMRKLSKICGFPFSTKTFRATFCTMVLDQDFDLLPSVSFQMGHSNEQTTRDFYNSCKMARSRAKTRVIYSSVLRPDMTKEATERIKVARAMGLLKHKDP